MTQVIGNPKWYELNDSIKETKQALQLAFSSFMDGEPCGISTHEMYNMMTRIKNLRYRRSYTQRYIQVGDNDSRLQHDGGIPSGQSKLHVPAVPTDSSLGSDGHSGGQPVTELEGLSTDGHWKHYRCHYPSNGGDCSLVIAAESLRKAVKFAYDYYGYTVNYVELI